MDTPPENKKNTTQRFSIDLERNEDAAKMAADVEPGDVLDAKISVVSKDDKTLVIELDEISDPSAPDDEDTEGETEKNSEGGNTPATDMMRGGGGY